MTGQPSATVLILGVGNPLMGDDALGIRVVQQLWARPDLPPGVTVLDGGTEGIGLVPVIEQYDRVILVDAVPMGLPAGTIRRFAWQEVRPVEGERALSLHQSSLTEALSLGEALGCLPDDIVIYGVQPHNMEWDQPLSPAVERAIPVLVETLIHEVRSKTQNEPQDFDH